MEEIKFTNKRLYNLDLLKFIASLCIALHHYQQAFQVKYDNGLNFYGGKIPFGYLVELFFIISGYLVAKSKYKDTFVNNVKKRWLRLFPYALIATLTAYIVFVVYYMIIGTHLLDRSYSDPCVIASLLMVHQGWIIEFIGVNNPTWYLCVLLWLYIVYYLINKLSDFAEKKYHKGNIFKIICYVGFMLLGMGIRFLHLDLPFLHESNGRGYTAFFIGVLLYYTSEKLEKKNRLLIGAIILLIGVVAIAMRIQLGLSLTLLVYPGLLLLLINVKQICFKPVGTLGDISFEIYIWHVPTYYLLYFIVSMTNNISLDNYIVMLLSLIIVVVVSITVHYVVNVPLAKQISKMANITTGGGNCPCHK